jgi:hypothetical protein
MAARHTREVKTITLVFVWRRGSFPRTGTPGLKATEFWKTL